MLAGLTSRWIRPAVGVLQRPRGLHHDLQGLLLLVDAAGVQLVLDRLALDQLHHQIVDGAHRADVDGLDDVVVAELGGDVRLAGEAVEVFRLGRQPLRQDFHGHQPVHAQLLRPVDRPAEARAQLVDHLVTGDHLVDDRRQFRHQAVGLRLGEVAGLHEVAQQRLRADDADPGAALQHLVAGHQAARDQGEGEAVFLSLGGRGVELDGFGHGGFAFREKKSGSSGRSGRNFFLFS
jgi:hypothetical protein